MNKLVKLFWISLYWIAISAVHLNAQNDCPPIFRSGDTLRTIPSSHYQWYKNGQPIQGATQQWILGSEKGNYSVEVSNRSTSRFWHKPPSALLTIKVQVMNLKLQPIPESRIEVGGQRLVTNEQGTVSLTLPRAWKRYVVHTEKAGFHSQTKGFFPSFGDTMIVNFYLERRSTTHQLEASKGGTIAYRNFILNFPHNAVETMDGNPYSGTIHLDFRAYDPTDILFNERHEGGINWGTDEQGNNKGIRSFGYCRVEMVTGEGLPLRLRSDKSVQIVMALNASQYRIAKFSIPLWHFDATKQQWKQEGLATRTDSSNLYYATVKHFSVWMFGTPYEPSFVTGRVLNCSGGPLEGIGIVDLTPKYGSDYGGDYVGSTDNDGYFTAVLEADQPYHLISSNYTYYLNLQSRDSLVGIAPAPYQADTLQRTLTVKSTISPAYAQHRPDSVLEVYAYVPYQFRPIRYSIDYGQTFHETSEFIVPVQNMVSHVYLIDAPACDTLIIPVVRKTTISYDCDSVSDNYVSYWNFYNTGKRYIPVNSLSIDITEMNERELRKAFQFNPCVRYLINNWSGSSSDSAIANYPFASIPYLKRFKGSLVPAQRGYKLNNERNYIRFLSNLLKSTTIEEAELMPYFLWWAHLDSTQDISELEGDMDTVTVNAPRLKHLTFDLGRYDRAPNFLFNLPELEELRFTSMNVARMNPQLFHKKLKSIVVWGECPRERYFPDSIVRLPSLHLPSLSQADTALKTISGLNLEPISLQQHLAYTGPVLYADPNSIARLQGLDSLDFSISRSGYEYNPQAYEQFRQLRNLKKMRVTYWNCFNEQVNGAIWDSLISAIVYVEDFTINAYGMCLVQDTTTLEQLTNFTAHHRIKRLKIANNPYLSSLPTSIINLTQLESLDLIACGIRSFPPQFERLGATLRYLNLRFNPIPQAEVDRMRALMPNTVILH